MHYHRYGLWQPKDACITKSHRLWCKRPEQNQDQRNKLWFLQRPYTANWPLGLQNSIWVRCWNTRSGCYYLLKKVIQKQGSNKEVTLINSLSASRKNIVLTTTEYGGGKLLHNKLHYSAFSPVNLTCITPARELCWALLKTNMRRLTAKPASPNKPLTMSKSATVISQIPPKALKPASLMTTMAAWHLRQMP